MQNYNQQMNKCKKDTEMCMNNKNEVEAELVNLKTKQIKYKHLQFSNSEKPFSRIKNRLRQSTSLLNKNKKLVTAIKSSFMKKVAAISSDIQSIQKEIETNYTKKNIEEIPNQKRTMKINAEYNLKEMIKVKLNQENLNQEHLQIEEDIQKDEQLNEMVLCGIRSAQQNMEATVHNTEDNILTQSTEISELHVYLKKISEAAILEVKQFSDIEQLAAQSIKVSIKEIDENIY